MALVGVIGGSGVYDIDALTDRQWKRVESPFGEPSDELLFGTLDGQRMVFLPRHGRGHRIPPSEINYRAHRKGFRLREVPIIFVERRKGGSKMFIDTKEPVRILSRYGFAVPSLMT